MKFSLVALALVGAAVALPNGMAKKQESGAPSFPVPTLSIPLPTGTASRPPRPTGGFPTGIPTGTFSIPIPTGKGKGRPTGSFSIPSGVPTGKGKGKGKGTSSPAPVPTSA